MSHHWKLEVIAAFEREVAQRATPWSCTAESTFARFPNSSPVAWRRDAMVRVQATAPSKGEPTRYRAVDLRYGHVTSYTERDNVTDAFNDADSFLQAE